MAYRFMVLGKPDGSTIIVDVKRARLWHLRRRVFAWTKGIEGIANQPGVRKAMFRLSYDTEGTLVPASNWEAGHISQFIDALHARMGKRLLAYAWVAEVQKRGAMHYHVLIVFRGAAPVPDKEYRGRDALGHWRHFKRLWPYGSSHCTWDVRTCYYLSTYVKKEYQKDFDRFPFKAHAWAVWIADSGGKFLLKYHSLTDKLRGRLLEVMLMDNCGAVEAWPRLQWMLEDERWIRKRDGIGWRYMGSINSAADVQEWGVTDTQLEEHIFTHLQRPA